jgi:hypothetical protein
MTKGPVETEATGDHPDRGSWALLLAAWLAHTTALNGAPFVTVMTIYSRRPGLV